MKAERSWVCEEVTAVWSSVPDLDEVSGADLALVAAELSASDRLLLEEFWSRVIEEAYASVSPPAGSPLVPAAGEPRRARRVVRQRTGRLLRLLPAARRAAERSASGEEAA